jgi:hypothetical protein
MTLYFDLEAYFCEAPQNVGQFGGLEAIKGSLKKREKMRREIHAALMYRAHFDVSGHRGIVCAFKGSDDRNYGGFGFSFSVESEVLLLGLLGGSLGTSENVFVFLFGEVDIVVSVRVTELGRVVSVVLPERVRAEVATLSVLPCLQGEVRDSSAFVVIGNGHSAFVGLVVNDLSTEIPLLLLLESLEDVVGADLHHRQLIVDAVVSTLFGSANLELADFLVAAAGDEVGNEGHVLGEFHGVFTVTTILVTKSLGLAVGLPVVVSLIVAMILVE